MADDPIARILADAYLAKYARPAPETADEWLARETAAQRERTLARVLGALRRGCEPPEADIAIDLLPGNHAIGKLARRMETSDAAKPIYRGSDHRRAA